MGGRVQCTVGGRVSVQALLQQFPYLRQPPPVLSLYPSLPSWVGSWGSWRLSVRPSLCLHRRSLLLSSPSWALFHGGLRLLGPRKFRCVTSCHVPCRHRSHTTLVGVLAPPVCRFVVAFTVWALAVCAAVQKDHQAAFVAWPILLAMQLLQQTTSSSNNHTQASKQVRHNPTSWVHCFEAYLKFQLKHQF